MQKFKAAPPVADINVNAHGGRDARDAHHFPWSHPHAVEGRQRGPLQGEETRSPWPTRRRKTAVVVAITRDGKTFLGKDVTPPEDLPAKVKDLISGRQDKTTYVRPIRRAKYSRVVEVVDNPAVRRCRSARAHDRSSRGDEA